MISVPKRFFLFSSDGTGAADEGDDDDMGAADDAVQKGSERELVAWNLRDLNYRPAIRNQ